MSVLLDWDQGSEDPLARLRRHYGRYLAWLDDGVKADDPANDEARTDWCYDLVDLIGPALEKVR